MNNEHHPSDNDQYQIPPMPNMPPQQAQYEQYNNSQPEQGKDKKKSRKGLIAGGIAGLAIVATAAGFGGSKLAQGGDNETPLTPDTETTAPAVPGEETPDSNEQQSSIDTLDIDLDGDILSQIQTLEINGHDNGELLSDEEFVEAYLERVNKWQMAGANQEDYDEALSALQAEGQSDPAVAEVAYKIAETHAPVFAMALLGDAYMYDPTTTQIAEEFTGVNAAALGQYFTAEQDSRSGVPYSTHFELGEITSTNRGAASGGDISFSLVQRDNAKQSGALYSVDGYKSEVNMATYSLSGDTYDEEIWRDINGKQVDVARKVETPYHIEKIEQHTLTYTDMGDDSTYVN